MIFSILSLILDFEKLVFITIYAPKCLCGLNLSADGNQSWHMSLFRWYVLHAAIGFLKFWFFSIFSPVFLDFEKLAFICVYALKCLCESYLSADSYQILHMSVLRWYVHYAAIGFSKFWIFQILARFWTLKIVIVSSELI